MTPECSVYFGPSTVTEPRLDTDTHRPGVLLVTADHAGGNLAARVCVDCLHDLCDGLREDGTYTNIRVTAPESREYRPHRG